MVFIARRALLVQPPLEDSLIHQPLEPAVWIFNLWGLADLLNAVVRGLIYTQDGTLGAAYWIPAMIVPPLVVSHVYIFGRLLREARQPASAPGVTHPAPVG